jgi:hypothetical protein
MDLVYRVASATKTFSLAQLNKATIGRAPDCNIVLLDRAVSRYHAHIEAIGGQYLIQDGNSSNGTFLNGLRLNAQSQVSLREGDVVEIGAVRFACGSAESLDRDHAPGERALLTDVGHPLMDLLRDGHSRPGLELAEIGTRMMRGFVGVPRPIGLQRGLELVADRVGVDTIALFMKENRSLKLVAGRPKHEAVRLLGDIARRAWERQEGRIVRGLVAVDSTASRDTTVQPLYSSAAVTIVEDSPMGVIAVERVEVHAFDRADLALLAVLGELLVRTLAMGSQNPNDTRFGVAEQEAGSAT